MSETAGDDEQDYYAQVHALFENAGQNHLKVSVCRGEELLAGPKEMPVAETRKMAMRCG